MANLWQFFGLPDPEGPPRDEGKKARPTAAKPPSAKVGVAKQAGQERNLRSLSDAIQAAKSGRAGVSHTSIPPNWQGPITSDGEPFHDLGEQVWQEWSCRTTNFPHQALRYIMPDENRHSLPLEGMATRLNQGDSLIVDIRSLIHMDAHQSACRRMLREMANDMGLVVFSLDDEDKLLMIPGVGVCVDISKHDLGQERALIL